MTARAAVTALALTLAAAGCGDSGGATTTSSATTTATAAADAGLAWVGKPGVFASRTLPNDRVVIAHVRNASNHTLHLIGAKIVVRDADGHALKSSAAFTVTFAHGLYGALEQPAGGQPVAEQIRLGKVVYLPPGATAPFYAAWRLKPGLRGPMRVDYGAGSLALPAPQSSPAP